METPGDSAFRIFAAFDVVWRFGVLSNTMVKVNRCNGDGKNESETAETRWVSACVCVTSQQKFDHKNAHYLIPKRNDKPYFVMCGYVCACVCARSVSHDV